MADHRSQVRAGFQGRDDAFADDRMQVHLDLPLEVELSRLEQDRVGYSNLADVVDDAAAIKRLLLPWRKAHPRPDPLRRLTDPLRMSLGVGVPRFGRSCQRVDDLVRAVVVRPGLEIHVLARRPRGARDCSQTGGGAPAWAGEGGRHLRVAAPPAHPDEAPINISLPSPFPGVAPQTPIISPV